MVYKINIKSPGSVVILDIPMRDILESDDILVNFKCIKSRDHLDELDIIRSIITEEPVRIQEENGFMVIKYKTVFRGFSRGVLLIHDVIKFKKINKICPQ